MNRPDADFIFWLVIMLIVIAIIVTGSLETPH